MMAQSIHSALTNHNDTTVKVFRYANNRIKYFTTSNFSKKDDYFYPDSTIIDFTGIDTSLYYKKYSYWNYVPLGDSPGPLVAGDINKDGHGIIFGDKYNSNLTYTSNVYAYQLNNFGKFDSVFSYDSTSFARSIYDINNDGKDELYLMNRYDFKIDSNSSMELTRNFIYTETGNQKIPQTLSFIFQPYPDNNSQQDCNTWGKFDNDQYPSEVFINEGHAHARIYKYNPLRNNLDSVYEYNYYNDDLYYQGFAVGDFENNGKTEIVMGSINGKVLMIKNTGLGTYTTISLGNVETYNAYLCFATNDLDGNGKKEIWVGGDAYFNGVPITRMTCFEYDGIKSYKIVGKIDFIGAYSLDAFNAFSEDVDNDGKDELVFDLGNTVVILKFAGSPNHQKYELFYAKQNEIPNSVYQGVSMADLNGDGKKELIISFFQYLQKPGDILYSYVLKPDFLDGINDNNPTSPNSFILYQNYPNPFNPSTTINYSIAKDGKVNLTLYNSIGSKVATIVNEYKPAGSYTVKFHGNNLASGIYLYRLESGNNTSAKKLIILK
jgi:hypothetical protein